MCIRKGRVLIQAVDQQGFSSISLPWKQTTEMCYWRVKYTYTSWVKGAQIYAAVLPLCVHVSQEKYLATCAIQKRYDGSHIVMSQCFVEITRKPFQPESTPKSSTWPYLNEIPLHCITKGYNVAKVFRRTLMRFVHKSNEATDAPRL